MSDPSVTIAGGGLSGLSAALTLARAGRSVVVHEKGAACGDQRPGDVEGLETWIFPEDPLAYLQAQGLPTAFEYTPIHTFNYIDPRGEIHITPAHCPFFYLVLRGAEKGCIDHAFQSAAAEAGVDLRFRSARQPRQVDIFAGGAGRAAAYVQGVVFSTSAQDGVYLLLGRRYAPRGYAYCIIWRGRGTIATAYKRERFGMPDPMAATTARFEQVIGLDIQNPRSFGAFGAYTRGTTPLAGGPLLVGEAAGFQDALFGFGMNYAIRSGVLAGRAVLEGRDYHRLWRAELAPRLASSWFNRRVFESLGEAARQTLAGYVVRRGVAWDMLHRTAQPSIRKRVRAWWTSRRVAWPIPKAADSGR